MNSKRVDEAPLPDSTNGFFLRLAEKNPSAPQHRIVDVAVLWSNVEVTTQQNTLAGLIAGVEERPEPLEPFQLEIVLVRAHDLSIRHVDVDDANSTNCRRN